MKVLLICAAGMSSSMLVKSMEEKSKEIGVPAEVKCIPAELFVEERERIGEYDYVLLAPQVRHYKGAVEEAIKNYPKIRLSIIEALTYALVKGDKLIMKVIEELGIQK